MSSLVTKPSCYSCHGINKTMVFQISGLNVILLDLPMKDLKRETAKLLAGASQNLAQLVASSSFEFWQRSDFRLYVNFGNISQTEQDRMFNELEVSVLGLFILHLDHAVSEGLEEEKKIVFSALKRDLASGFLQVLSNVGIEKKFIDQLKVVIDMRLKEYREDFKLAMKESSKWKEFKNENQKMKITWARIETVTIDCLTHIRRGDVKEGDPLWKLLRKWFITLDAKLNPLTQAKP